MVSCLEIKHYYLTCNESQTITNGITTGCPTRYRTRHFFNNSNTNGAPGSILSGRKWWSLPAYVMMWSHFLHNEVSPLQISLQYPH